MTVPAVFGISAVVLLAGFAGRILFEKTRIPDIPLLLGIGVILGGVLLGGLGGLLWIKVLTRTGKMPLSYMLTLAVLRSERRIDGMLAENPMPPPPPIPGQML